MNMDYIKNKIKNEPSKTNRSNWLELAKKDERGVPMPTGVHRVRLLRGEESRRTNFRGIDEEGIMLYFEEDGIEKQYFIPTYVSDKNSDNYGKFHYLFENFANIEEGAELEMEYVKKGKAGFVNVKLVGKQQGYDDETIPVIEDEDYKKTFGEEQNLEDFQ
jgi:hypothetical protein